MKRLTIFLFAAWIAVMTASTAYAQVKRVAVVETEMDAQSGAAKMLSKADVRQITAVLRKEAVKNLPQGKYEIMTTETVMSQGSAKLEECADENCVITLGSKIGADYIVRGTVSKMGTKLTVSVDIYETENGNLVASSDLVRSGNIEELVDKTAAACGEMYKTFESVRNSLQKSAQKAPVSQQVPQTPPPQPVVTAPQPTYQSPAQTYQPPALTQTLGTFTDSRDRRTYKTVVIGGKTWMAENLNYKNGKSWCYTNDDSNCGKYGRLYDWKTAKTVCPAGWHLPSRQEWDNLVAAVGGKDVAGKKLKARSGWNDYNGKSGNGTDEYGFSALPGGRRITDGDFYDAGDHGSWWTATEYGSGYAYYRYMNYDYDGVLEGYYDKGRGFSVHCVND